MPNVISRIEPAVKAPTPDQLDPIMQIAMRQLASMSMSSEPQAKPQDQLRRFPAEVRILIFEQLLCVWPTIIYRGAWEFGPLDEREFEEEFELPWQILATCRTYYHEAAPIMYSMNRFVFCTGKFGKPGMFSRFPIQVRYMQFLTDLGIFLRCDSPTAEAAKRVAHFITALTRRAVKLEHLTILISASTQWAEKCPWDILFCNHPVAKAIIELIEAKTVTHLKIRLHDNAFMYSGFASFLQQTFNKDGPPANRTLVFSRSCTCPPIDVDDIHYYCLQCDWPFMDLPLKPVEEIVSAIQVEANEERTMNTQENLFALGLLPLADDSEDVDEEIGDKEVDDKNAGLYSSGPPIEDDYEENRKAFSAGTLLPGEVQRFRGKVFAPKVWSFEQPKVTNFFKAIKDDREHLSPIFHQCGASRQA